MTITALDALPPLRDVIARHELMARKSLGQHFLCDLNLTRSIAEEAGDLSDHTVFEIGPGPGGLTRALLSTKAKKIIAIEKDHRCIAALQEVIAASEGRLEVLEGDALKMDLTTLSNKPRAVVANLPYNIGTELLLNWLHHMEDFTSLTLMFQAEVADRLAAGPDNKTYGRLSVIAQFCCSVQRVMDLPARAFTPPPKVDSAVVHLMPRQDRPKDIALKDIEKVTMAAFGQRRKMLRSSLKPLGGEDLLKRAGINPELRAENLSVQDFETIVRNLNGPA
ncbi:MAG: 16S rRNA (adenine(1518)-N(6)/adenine(1519)-N(6))-dimethyltransferase RsmA [Alphaproteobacteria bacterium]